MTAIIVLGCGIAHAYNYHLDSDITSFISEGTRLAHKYQTAEQNQHALMQEKQALDQRGRALSAEQSAYDKQAAEHENQASAQDKATHDTQAECNNSDISNNSSEHVNWCDNHIRKLHAQNQTINAETGQLETQQEILKSKTDAFNKDALEWNRHQMLTVSTFNDASQRLNDWLNRVYAFMNTTDFQGNIGWAHAGTLCADYKSREDLPAEVILLKQAQHTLTCLQFVEHARKKYYQKPH